MPAKNQGRIRVSGAQRKNIDVDQMVQALIAWGREMETRRKHAKAEPSSGDAKGAAS
jgi:hypothetical protein